MAEATYTAKDLKSSVDVKWCAGCGDHAILNSMQKAIAQTGVKHENIAVVSGIGCSSRLPYYMNTYGMHTIHGRASAIATGLKVANPELQVWQVTGDGDALAIGGNHFIHAIRRNIDLNIILFNNEIYGLTKGQFSPTTRKGEVTKTSPFGHIESPFNAGELTIGSQGRFFARSTDTNMKLTTDIMVSASGFKGTSVIEVLQNCVIFNHNTHSHVTDKDVKAERQLMLEHGKPMIFGKEKNKGLILDGMELKVVTIGENGITEEDILVHDKTTPNPALHLMLINMKTPDFPIAFGIIREVEDTTFNDAIDAQIEERKKVSKFKTVNDLFNSGDTWDVK